MSPVGTGAFALDSTDWVEAAPAQHSHPCFFTAGMLADFLGRLPTRRSPCSKWNVAAARCALPILSATPEVLKGLQRDDGGRSYQEALSV
jgi:hypothetical protein